MKSFSKSAKTHIYGRTRYEATEFVLRINLLKLDTVNDHIDVLSRINASCPG